MPIMPFMQGCLGHLGTLNLINSVQPFKVVSTSTSATYTLPTSVTLANSFIVWGGWTCQGNGSSNDETCGCALTATNTVTSYQYSSGTGTSAYGTVVELKSSAVVMIHSFSINIPAGNTPATYTLPTSITNLNNALVFYNGMISSSGAAYPSMDELRGGLAITAANTVTAYPPSTHSYATTLYGTVVEFASGVLSASQQSANVSIAASATTASQTLSPAVSPSDTMLVYGGQTNPDSSGSFIFGATAGFELAADGSAINFTRGYGVSTVTQCYAQVAPISSIGVKSIERGYVSVSSGASGVGCATYTLTNSVDTTKAFVSFFGYEVPGSSGSSPYWFYFYSAIRLTAANTVTVDGDAAGAPAAYRVYFEVVYLN